MKSKWPPPPSQPNVKNNLPLTAFWANFGMGVLLVLGFLNVFVDLDLLGKDWLCGVLLMGCGLMRGC